MPAATVEALGPEHYVSFLEPVGDGKDAVTHRALVRFVGADVPLEAYVKIYCFRTAGKGIANELAGYVLAKNDGLDVPQRGGILLLAPEQSSFLPSAFTPQKTKSGFVVAWCVESIGGATPLQLYRPMGGAGFSVLQADFARWKNLSKVVSLDAWLLNEDRNMGNLVRMGVGRYALIDHGRICTGNHWAVPIDRARMKHTNKLALVAWGNADIDSAPNQARASILQACDGHSSAYMLSLPALQRWFVDLIQEDESKDAQGFFAERSGSVGRHLRTAYGVLI